MSKDILLVVDAVSNEKGVSRDVIFNALECAIAMATKKSHEGNVDINVQIDRNTGEYQAFQRWQVVADEVKGITEISLEDARNKNADINVGEFVEEAIESISFGRIGVQTAKQVIVQKIREAERAKIIENYKEREGELVNGVVKRVERGNIILDLGENVEAIIFREEMIPRETVRNGDRLRGYLQSVRSEPRGPQLFLSRIAPELLIKLFDMEVPEIGEKFLEIVNAARDPGLRAKIAVKTNDSRIDPIGACVGMRGSRIQTISNELTGERVDIILWDENPAQFVMNAMSPAEVVSIIVDEEAHSMDVAVNEEQLSQAIGRNGQNVRLATELTGWNLNIMTESQASAKYEQETTAIMKLFVDSLEVDKEIAEILIQEGFSSLEEVAYVPLNEISNIEEFDEELIKELRTRAKDTLLLRAIASEEKADKTDELSTIDGITPELIQVLEKHGIITIDSLAEQSVEDLMILDGIDEANASQLIMNARASWFDK
ncbi:MAG: transcription termination/antitermination protein NusA [Candidatus Marithrix sp.]|nr:transcription termination/antitermination protein NusA [Candidatus Marithrix sp.]